MPVAHHPYYVYMYLDPDTGLPFYVGKGKGQRARAHLLEARRETSKDKNLHKIRKIQKLLAEGKQPTICFADEGLTEKYAFELEAHLIAGLGRADLGLGALTNMSNGGEGIQGRLHDFSGENNPNFGKRGADSIWWGKKHDEETKRQISAAQKGRVFSDGHKQAMRKPKSEEGRQAMALARLVSTYRPSEETKKKLSIALSGRPSHRKGSTTSEATKAKQSAATKGIQKPKIPCPHCLMMVAANVRDRWHFDNCKARSQS